jgi:hypothetical protein
MHHLIRPRNTGLVLLALILAAAVYGFAAANTVPNTYAGDGSGTILGYTVSSIVYTLNSDGNPGDIDSVAFTLSAAAGQAYVSFDGGTTWNSCVISGGTSVTCGSLNESVASAASLRIVASN